MSDPSRMALASRVVAKRLGLHYPENKYSDLSSGINNAAVELGFGEKKEEFISRVIDQTLSGKEFDVLAEQLTIGETYFFRDRKILDAFREMIIPAIVKERENTTRTIRIWSAGCCSGEEPYTLAIILTESLPDITSWNILILATDINRRFLQKARNGIYTPWSFRETPAEIQHKYFTHSGKQFEISPGIRNMVKFMPLNLVSDPFPTETTDTRSMDVIFCRNVLMYFSSETARNVGAKFYHSLADNGWYITSQVELSDELIPMLTKVSYQNSFLYRKIHKQPGPGKKEQVIVSRRPVSQALAPQAKGSAKEHQLNKKRHPAPEKTSSDKAPEPEPGLLSLARDLANRGEFSHAAKQLEQLIVADRVNPEAFYLLGTVLFEQGEMDEAEKNLKKALYLDPHHLMAHFQMLTLCLRAGKKKQAQIHRRNIDKMLEEYQDEQAIPESEGMTAGNLKNQLAYLNNSIYDG